MMYFNFFNLTNLVNFNTEIYNSSKLYITFEISCLSARDQ